MRQSPRAKKGPCRTGVGTGAPGSVRSSGLGATGAAGGDGFSGAAADVVEPGPDEVVMPASYSVGGSVRQPLDLAPARHMGVHLGEREGLRQHRASERAELPARRRASDDVAGHEDDAPREPRGVRLEPAVQLEAGAVVEPDVDEGAIEFVIADEPPRARHALRRVYLVPGALEPGAHDVPQRLVV